MESKRVFSGVGFSAAKSRLTVATLSPSKDVLSLKELSLEEAAQELVRCAEITVAVGGPLRPSVPQASDEAPIGETLRRGKARRARAAEKELVRRGIPAQRTPNLAGAAPAWMRSSMRLAAKLAELGLAGGKESRESPRTVIETHPAACAAVLLGRLPFGRETLEGRIQRQLVLLREKVALPDPMDALEEITAHHLLSGRLALDGIRRGDELDALFAAYTAWRAWSLPDAVVWVGDDSDGWICLPVAELKDKYYK